MFINSKMETSLLDQRAELAISSSNLDFILRKALEGGAGFCAFNLCCQLMFWKYTVNFSLAV